MLRVLAILSSYNNDILTLHHIFFSGFITSRHHQLFCHSSLNGVKIIAVPDSLVDIIRHEKSQVKMAGIYLSHYILARDLIHPNSRDK